MLLNNKQQYYLNPQFFILRAVIYFAIWNLVAWMVRYLAARWLASGSLADSRILRKFCGFGLVTYGATFTFAAIDWFMSLEPKWWSAIYPVMLAIGQLLTAYGFSVIVFLVAGASGSGGVCRHRVSLLHRRAVVCRSNSSATSATFCWPSR